MIQQIRRAKAFFRLLRELRSGVRQFRRSGDTPEAAYYAFLTLFCKTRGLSNELLHLSVRLRHRAYRLTSTQTIFRGVNARAALSTLRREGYFVFPERISGSVITGLVRFARQTPALCESADHKQKTVYDPARPEAIRYFFGEDELLQLPEVQALVMDSTILDIAQRYLGCSPILDIATMWWSTAVNKVASAQAAQLFHFDMDRIKWLKFFLLLTDVSEENGPTCFVAGSHRLGAQPGALLRHGYARLSDEEVRKHYAPSRFVHFTGKAGTLIAVDTRGFHKGERLRVNDRLVLQLEFCDSLFGARYERTRVPLPHRSPLFEWARKYPRIFSKYALEPL